MRVVEVGVPVDDLWGRVRQVSRMRTECNQKPGKCCRAATPRGLDIQRPAVATSRPDLSPPPSWATDPQHSRHLPGNSQRRGQAGGLDAVQVHQSCHAVLRGPLEQKICRRLTGARQLGSDAGVAG